jgi:uncharacterized protein
LATGSSIGTLPPEYQVFIKPVGGLCNLRCSYCYYNCFAVNCGGTGVPVMDSGTLETFTRQNIEASSGNLVNFSWHGGEPTLAGIDFYRRAVALQKKHAPPGTVIVNGIQTNGTLIDNDWCQFLAKENFTVGISIDGTMELHDFHRKTTDGSGSFNTAVSAFHLLRKYGLSPEILCVVSDHNAGFPLEIYRSFREMGAAWMTFLPLVVRDNARDAGVSPASVRPEMFGEFLCAIFDEWVENDIGRIKIQIIEEATRVAFDQEHTLCIFKRECGGVPVVERNGDFYSCDHFVNEDNHIGNILTISLAELLESDRQIAFGKAKWTTLPQYCIECEVLAMCNGECPKNRFMATLSGEPGLNYLCEGYKRFFNHIIPFARTVAQVHMGIS